ncbi:MAG TPA: ribonuclease E/G, partial [Thermoguttaceae bacterium]
AYQINLLAAKEIARQIRLRDLGGVIVNDFIDMRKEKHRRGVERALRDAVKRDRARTKILRTSPFGLIEMTRQRVRTNPKLSAYTQCPSCNGTGMVKTPESMGLEVIRLLIVAGHRPQIAKIAITVTEEVADYLNNRKRHELAHLEDYAKVTIKVIPAKGVPPEYLSIECRDNEDREIKINKN